jgi:hypothetical protein
MFSTMTGMFQKAAVPHEPTPGPMRNPSTALLYSSGRLGPAPPVMYFLSASMSRIEHLNPGYFFSTMLAMASSVSAMVARRAEVRAAAGSTAAADSS